MSIIISPPESFQRTGPRAGRGAEFVDHRARLRNDLRLTGTPWFAVNVPPNALEADAALVSAMARGDQQAAARVYDRHVATVFGLALRMLGEVADAEEVAVDVFAQAWREAARFDGTRGSVVGWLTTIARTRSLDMIRSRKRRDRATDSAGTMLDAPAAMGEGFKRPDALVEDADRASAVSLALRALPDTQRDAIELAFFEGLTHPEVAERLREPLGTVKTRIRLGMHKLRDSLAGLASERAI